MVDPDPGDRAWAGTRSSTGRWRQRGELSDRPVTVETESLTPAATELFASPAGCGRCSPRTSCGSTCVRSCQRFPRWPDGDRSWPNGTTRPCRRFFAVYRRRSATAQVSPAGRRRSGSSGSGRRGFPSRLVAAGHRARPAPTSASSAARRAGSCRSVCRPCSGPRAGRGPGGRGSAPDAADGASAEASAGRQRRQRGRRACTSGSGFAVLGRRARFERAEPAARQAGSRRR